MGSVIVGGILLLIALLKFRRRFKGRFARLFANVGLSLWMVLFLITCIECGFAFFYDTTDSFNMTNVSKRWFRVHIEPQQHALRLTPTEGILYREESPTFPEPGEIEPHHICFVGDSFTMGHGVPNVTHRFSNRIGKRLQETNPEEFLVTNLADAGKDLFWVSRVSELMFEQGYDIDTLVYVMCLNDIESFDKNFQSYYADLGQHDPHNVFFKETYFLNLVYFRARQFSLPQVRDYYSFVKEYYEGEQWQKMSDKLRQLNELCKANGTQLRVVVFPFLHNVGEDYPFMAAHKTVREFCERIDVSVLDLEPVFREHANDSLTVNPFDAHPNPLAHSIAARAMREKLFVDLWDTRAKTDAADKTTAVDPDANKNATDVP